MCVFCGASSGRSPAYTDAARAFGETAARRRLGLVFGGGRVGLMGALADGALGAGGDVVGVIPQSLVDRELAHAGVTRLEVVASLHERKARMAELADAFIALPGGAGTLEELFEVWTWGQLGLHAKPVALLNVGGFYTPLLAQLTAMADAGYINEVYRAALGVVADADEFLRFVAAYNPPPLKWRPAQAEA